VTADAETTPRRYVSDVHLLWQGLRLACWRCKTLLFAGNYIDKKCPFTGNVSIRGRILTGAAHRSAAAAAARTAAALMPRQLELWASQSFKGASSAGSSGLKGCTQTQQLGWHMSSNSTAWQLVQQCTAPGEWSISKPAKRDRLPSLSPALSSDATGTPCLKQHV
jgi:hypothetical protein